MSGNLIGSFILIDQRSSFKGETVLVFLFHHYLIHLYNMTNELPNLSEHVLNWLKNEEDISSDFRNLIESELLRRSLELSTDEPIVLTSKMLHDASTCGYNGFTAKQLKVFGIKWPPPKGWLKDLVGTTIMTSQYKKFVDAGKKSNSSNLPQPTNP